jgi:hypothetical protein
MISLWKRKLALRITRKKEWVTYKGGQCSRCGYRGCVQALTFHHVDPALKRFYLTDGGGKIGAYGRGCRGRTKKEIFEELDRCILLCANCHAELHAGLWTIGELVQTSLLRLNQSGLTTVRNLCSLN